MWRVYFLCIQFSDVDHLFLYFNFQEFQSYLNYPRIHFAGQFQADVSTVNNLAQNYDTINFDGRQLEYGSDLGGWNPFGSGHFRILNASVVRVCNKLGKCTTERSKDKDGNCPETEAERPSDEDGKCPKSDEETDNCDWMVGAKFVGKVLV